MVHAYAFDSISICLSKGLGAPVGSVLLGSEEFIHHSRRIRKRIGGGWRQAGLLAGAAIYALENNVDRLADDHAAAKDIAEFLGQQSWVKNVVAPEKGIGISQMGPGKCRMVFHLDITPEHIKEVKSVLAAL